MKQRRPLTTKEVATLAKVERRYGRTWKQHIRAIWLEASPRDDEESLLYALRNSHGPAWLAEYTDAQPALPGAESVRETENPTPTEDAPFSLTRPASDRRAHQKGLF